MASPAQQSYWQPIDWLYDWLITNWLIIWLTDPTYFENECEETNKKHRNTETQNHTIWEKVFSQ